MIIATNIEPPDEPDIFRLSYIEGLIRHSTFDHDTQEQMYKDIRTMDEAELTGLETLLVMNQLDNIYEAGNYSATELIKRIP
jgi:hypothetical protein